MLFHRNQSEWTKVLDDRAKVPGAVKETLRYWAPSQYQGRVLTDDVTAHGVTIPKGSRVLLLNGAANRDEREYASADRFDIERPHHVAVGFGYGLHFRLGTALARLEGRVGLEEFAARAHEHGYASVPSRRCHKGFHERRAPRGSVPTCIFPVDSPGFVVRSSSASSPRWR